MLHIARLLGTSRWVALTTNDTSNLLESSGLSRGRLLLSTSLLLLQLQHQLHELRHRHCVVSRSGSAGTGTPTITSSDSSQLVIDVERDTF